VPESFGRKNISAMVLELEDGQEWDDPLTITLRRDEWLSTLVANSSMLRDIKEGVDAAKEAAIEGDPYAMLIGPQLVKSAKLLQDAMRGMTRVIHPALMDEVDAIDAAEEAYSKHKGQRA